MRKATAWTFFSFVLFCSLALPALAENEACRNRTVPVTVVDSRGLPASELHPADFEAKFHGNPVQILSVSRDTHGRRVIIALDVSGSMLQAEERDKWTVVREVAGDAVLHLTTDTQIAMELFDEKIIEVLDFTAGRQAVARRIVTLASGIEAVPSKSRHTALWDSLLKSLSIFGSPQPGDAVYLITDGGDNESRVRPKQVESAFLEKGVRLFAFLIVSGGTLGPGAVIQGEQQGLDVVKRLTESTGGNYMVFIGARPLVGQPNFRMSEQQKAEVADRAQALYAQIKEFSWFHLGLSSPVDKTRDWTLALNRASRKARQDLQVFYPHKLLACDQTSPD